MIDNYGTMKKARDCELSLSLVIFVVCGLVIIGDMIIKKRALRFNKITVKSICLYLS